ncbi:MAG: sigma 54-interacting transcriptional regulator [Myxococcota bacterium]
MSALDRTMAIPHLREKLSVKTIRATVAKGPDVGQRAEGERVTVGSAEGNELQLEDPTVSGYHLELVGTDRGIEVVDLSSTNGTRYAGAWIRSVEVAPGVRLELGNTALELDVGADAEVALHPSDALGGIRGRSDGIRRMMAFIAKVADSHSSVLVIGESGTGKELVAQALHEGSPRADGPFVTVDCGAMTAGLVRSELFGHERGAFTGADRQHIGAFERAHGGTVMLDEIGELPAELQTTLLGVLERRRIRRVGGTQEIPIDVRVVAATNRDLRHEVNEARFRLDLYYRLAVVPVRVPPLRDRTSDLPLLIDHFLRECGHDGPSALLFSPDHMRRLTAYGWPGNVRELRNLVEATVVTGEAQAPGFLALEGPASMASPGSSAAGFDEPTVETDPATQREGAPTLLVDYGLPYKEARAALLHRFEEEYLERLLEGAAGNVSKASRMAKMTRSHLFELLRRHGLR